MVKPRVERWKTKDKTKREIHFYIGDEYVFGFNPRYFSKKKVSKFMNSLKPLGR